MNVFLFVGLGNPTTAYARTRHNVGFTIVEAFGRAHQGVWRADRLGQAAQVSVRGRKIVLLKPDTYMNESGKAVKYWMDKLAIPPSQLLVVVDDLHLALGHCRLRMQGSSGGHNGLKSVETHLQHAGYPRLRFGIGNDFPKGFQSEFVLSKWTEPETRLLEAKLPAVVEALQSYVIHPPSGVAQIAVL